MHAIDQLDVKTQQSQQQEPKESMRSVSENNATSSSRFGLIDLWKIHRNSKSAHRTWKSVL
ncbi:MAG: hypothetical protein FGM61_03500 [Sediminibacterium sp.]|nr:hypothetical protein [Sediminibacterium sp.]